MEIIDLTEEHKDLFCLCLEDWSDEAAEAGPRRRAWLDRMEPLGLRAQRRVVTAHPEQIPSPLPPFVEESMLYMSVAICVELLRSDRSQTYIVPLNW